MSSNYIFPSISHLVCGYDCTVSLPTALLLGKLETGTGTCLISFKVYSEGAVCLEEKREIHFQNGTPVGLFDLTFHVTDHAKEWDGHGGFLEISISSANGDDIFSSQRPLGLYAIYSKAGKKSFFSDVSFRYASPPIIDQVATFGKYVDTYPITHLDKAQNLGESVALINPYRMPLVARVQTHDDREIKRIKVPPESARYIPLDQILRDYENEWIGQIQITASNRVVTYAIKHDLDDPSMISDHEHMDPFRADPTHLPFFQLLRNKYGLMRRNMGF